MKEAKKIIPSSVLQEKRTELADSFMNGDEPEFMERNSDLLDEYFRESFEKSLVGPEMGINRNPYAIIAQGGYGRQEQCVHSDVDLLFLFHEIIPAQAEELVREVVYPLWDIGLEIGYATRTIKECVSLASEDFEVLTSLLDVRFLCGASDLYSRLKEGIREKVVKKKSKKIVKRLIDANLGRHRRFGDASFLLEPNLKDGQGGLRDYHTILWISRVMFDLKHPRDLEYFGQLSHSEFESLMQATQFIFNVRNRLHSLTRRRNDQLHLEYQTVIAGQMGFVEQNGHPSVESFLGTLHEHSEFIKQLYKMFKMEIPQDKLRSLLSPTKKIGNSFIIQNKMLNFSSSELLMDDPELLFGIFDKSARMKLPLNAEAKRLVRDFSSLVDDDVRKAAKPRKIFERVLTTTGKGVNVLSEMHMTGLLTSYIPEFIDTVNRIEYDSYHHYTVDRHSILTVRNLNLIGTKDDPTSNNLCSDILKEIKSRKLLLLGAFFHDIGKGQRSFNSMEKKSGNTRSNDSDEGHAEMGADIASGVLKRMGYSKKDIETIVFLVREHNLLLDTAKKRDINEEETAIVCARKISSPDRLKMLYLLTVADLAATGPIAWSEWTSVLVRELFLKMLTTIDKGGLGSDEAAEQEKLKKAEMIEQAKEAGLGDLLDNLIDSMPPRYLQIVPVEDILDHIGLYSTLGSSEFVWEVKKVEERNTRIITVCAKDRPGLFSQIAGVFALNNLEVLTAQVFTWKNDAALDIFEVTAPVDTIFEDEIWAKTRQSLLASLGGELDLSRALDEKMKSFSSRSSSGNVIMGGPPRINVDNVSSSYFTIIEIYANDFPGLLYGVTDSIFKSGFDVWIAKVTTGVDQAVDVFYVRDFEGQKLSSASKKDMLIKNIHMILPGAEMKIEDNDNNNEKEIEKNSDCA